MRLREPNLRLRRAKLLLDMISPEPAGYILENFNAFGNGRNMLT